MAMPALDVEIFINRKPWPRRFFYLLGVILLCNIIESINIGLIFLPQSS